MFGCSRVAEVYELYEKVQQVTAYLLNFFYYLQTICANPFHLNNLRSISSPFRGRRLQGFTFFSTTSLTKCPLSPIGLYIQ